MKNDFQIFTNQPKLIYLDSAASAQKPVTVLKAINDFYTNGYSNVHRGNYTLSEEATELYENTRSKVAKFINADSKEIIFTSGTTDSLNKLANSLEKIIKTGAILATVMEHHSNFLPWQQLALRNNFQFEMVGITSDYRLDINKLYDQVKKYQPAVVALSHMSNVLGTINPISEISKQIKKLSPSTLIVVDAAQSIPHMKIDVKELGCDALAFSGHKMFASTGIGVLYVNQQLLEKLEPTTFGGGMINKVQKNTSTWAEAPTSFEAGTPNIEGVISLGAAIDYINNIGYEKIKSYEKELSEYFLESAIKLPGLKLYGPAENINRGPVFSFSIAGIHPHDVSTLLNEDNIAVRAGHHCVQILHRDIFGIPATVRVSLSIYNTKQDIDALFVSLNNIIERFKK